MNTAAVEMGLEMTMMPMIAAGTNDAMKAQSTIGGWKPLLL
jgi:hypothetical protein